VDDHAPVFDLMDACPFAAVLTPDPSDVSISHVPLTLHRSSPGEQGLGRLVGHVARANPHWRRFDGETACVAIFQGPHAYVSPGWYTDAPAVPTWNYVVAHAYGRPKLLDEGDDTSALLDELVSRHEPGGGPLDVPDAFRRSLERGIVGFAFEIERLESKFKLGQNRSGADRVSTVRALEENGLPELAAWTRRITDVP
jgi:transcriptional regulator